MYLPIDQSEATDSVTRSKWTMPHMLSNYTLVAALWVSCLLFGTHMVLHYLRSSLLHRFEEWEWTDVGLYHPTAPTATCIMALHFVGGVVLLTLGPIQLIPWFRKKYIWLHRITGRIYLLSALIAASGGTIYVLLVGTTIGRVADVSNVLFGLACLVSTVETYRHVKFTKKIELHKKWAWRLFSLAMGSLAFRLYAVVRTLVFHQINKPTGIAMYVMSYSFFVPNLIIVELRWLHGWKVGLWTTVLLFLLTLFVIWATYWAWELRWLPPLKRDFQVDL